MEPPGPRLRAELGRRAGIDVGEEAAAAAFRAEMDHYVAHHLEGRDPGSLEDLRRRCAAVVRDALGLGRVELGTVYDALLASLSFRAYPDAAPALRALRERGVRLVVASNWDCSLPGVLARTGLAPLLDGAVSSASVGAAKPDAALFEAALGVAGCGPARALHVGDSPERDVEGARAAGIEAVLIVRDAGGAPPGVPTIRTLGEVVAAIEGPRSPGRSGRAA